METHKPGDARRILNGLLSTILFLIAVLYVSLNLWVLCTRWAVAQCVPIGLCG